MATTVAKKLLENSMFLIAGRLFSRAMQFLVFIYAARQLGVAAFGLFSFAYATVSLFALAMDLGLASYLVQQLSRHQVIPPPLLKRAMTLKALLIPVGLSVILGGGYLLSKTSGAMLPLVILGLAAAVDSITALFNAVFEARQQMKYTALIIALSNGAMSLIGLAVLFLFPGLPQLCAVFALGAVMRCTFSGIVLRRKIPFSATVEDPQATDRMLAKAFPFALVTIFVTIYYYIDTLILTACCDVEVVGQYNAAYRLLEAPLFVIQAVTTALFPAAAGFHADDPGRLRLLTTQVVEKAFAFGFSVAIVTAMMAGELVKLLYGQAYAEAGGLLAVLIFSVAIIMPSTVCGTTLRATDRQWISALVTGLGALLNIGLNLVLAPRFQAMGAAWATVATEGFVLVVYAAMVWRWVGPLISVSFVLRLAVLGLLWLAAMTLTRPVGVIGQIIAAIVLFFPFLMVSGITKPDELRSVLRRKASS